MTLLIVVSICQHLKVLKHQALLFSESPCKCITFRKIITLEEIVTMKVRQCIDSQQIIYNKILPVKYADMLGIKTVVKNYDFATRNVQSFKTM